MLDLIVLFSISDIIITYCVYFYCIFLSRRQWMDCERRLGSLGNSFTAEEGRQARAIQQFGPSGVRFCFVPALLRSILTRLSSYLLRLFLLFYSCCPNARMFVRTLLLEFHISYNHTEWYLPFSDSATTSAQSESGGIWQYQTKHM